MDKYDAASYAATKFIDGQLKRAGDYRDDPRNEAASTIGSTLLGAVGTAIGGPVLGVLTSTLGHCIGQSAEFPGTNTHRSSDSSEDARLSQHSCPNIDYDNL